MSIEAGAAPDWEQRYRAPVSFLPEWSPHAPDRCVYASNESGGFEVYVRPFGPVNSESTSNIRLSVDSGDYAQWRSDGRELYYLTLDGKIAALDVKTGATGPKVSSLMISMSWLTSTITVGS